MNIKSERTIHLTLSGSEFKDLCTIIDFGRFYLEDLIKELSQDKEKNKAAISAHLRSIEISKIYTNERARL